MSWRAELMGMISAGRSGVFVDVGANLGQTLMDHLLVHPDLHYVGFEPILQSAAFVDHVIARNSLAATILPIALSDKDSISTLYSRRDVSTDDQATLLAGLRPERPCATRFVPIMRFDAIRPYLGTAGEVNTVKIDVEGAELQVLKGMLDTLTRCRPPIICEVLLVDRKADVAEYQQRVEELWRLLDRLEYGVRRVVKLAGHLHDLEPVERFPVENWTRGNADRCDYLFMPREAAWPRPSG